MIVLAAVALMVAACSTGQSGYNEPSGPPDRGSQPRGSFNGE